MSENENQRDDGQNLPMLGGFGNIEDQVEGEEQQFAHVIQGTKLKFTNDFVWMASSAPFLPKERELVIVGLARVVQKWVDEVPVETIFVPRGAKWPNVAKMNEGCKAEWVEKFGKLQGPYQASRVVYFLDLNTMERFTFPSPTWGAELAFREFRDAWNDMKTLRGDDVYAVVTLGDTYMSNSYGGRQRPAYKVKRYIKIGPDGRIEAVIPLSAPDASPVRTIDAPNLSERMGGEEIPWK